MFPQRVEFEAVTRDAISRVRLPIPGGFTIYNALGVLACGLVLGLPLDGCAAALGAARGVKGRIEVVPTPTDYTVLIDYAHTPDALENILTTVRDFTPGRVICLFGCGGDRDRTKRPRMGAVAGALADVDVYKRQGCTCPPDFPVCVCGKKPQVKLVNKKPIVSGAAELEENPRARSAKLRVAEKL